MASKNTINDTQATTVPENKDFLSELLKMEHLMTGEDQNQRRNEVIHDWEDDSKNLMEKLMVTKDMPDSDPTYPEVTGSPYQRWAKTLPSTSQESWNSEENGWKNKFEAPPSSYYLSELSSLSRGKISQPSFPPVRQFHDKGNRNLLNYFESDFESISNLSSMDNFTSVSCRATSSSASPCQLARSLVEFPDYQATLLTLLDQYQYDHKQIRLIVVRYPETFEIEGEMVRLRPKVCICHRHLDTEGCPVPQTCQDLHICVQYINGRCQDEDCVLGHFLHTDHNKPILDNFHLDVIPVKFILCLLKFILAPSSGAPKKLKVCEAYNANGCIDKQCQMLHLCLKLLAKCCSVDSGCQLNHKVLSEQASSILESHGVSLNESPRDILIQISSSPLIKKEVEALKEESIQPPNTQTKMGGGEDASGKVVPLKTSWSHEFKGEVTLNEICYDSVEGSCPYEKSGCWRLHCDFHFHWQVRSTTKDKKRFWINLTEEQALALEMAFCDPSIDKMFLVVDPDMNNSKELLDFLGGWRQWEADFDSMLLRPDLDPKNPPLELRRLLTEDLANKPTIPDACVFKWFFLDHEEQWVEYGKTTCTGGRIYKSNLTSDSIEKFLRQNGDDSVMHFNTQFFSYLLDLQNRTQTNLETYVTRKVRRRPQTHLRNNLPNKTFDLFRNEADDNPWGNPWNFWTLTHREVDLESVHRDSS